MAKFSPSSAAAESKNCLPLVPKGRWHGEAMPEGIRTTVPLHPVGVNAHIDPLTPHP